MPEGEYLQYGGQAIIEGVMMRSPRYFSVACRAPSGEIVQVTEALEKTWFGRQKWLRLPFMRGSFALFDSMGLGIRAMRFASNVQLSPPAKDEGGEGAEGSEGPEGPEGSAGGGDLEPAPPSKKLQDTAIAGAIVFAFAFGIFLFVILPNLLAQTLQKRHLSGMEINVVTEVIKIVFFFGYILLISRNKDIQEVFRYHGAEHKAINTLEAKEDLTIANCLAQTRLHPRCGTSFAVVVLLASLVIFTFVPRYPLGESRSILLNTLVRVGLEILILPIIAGLAYELIRFAGKFRNQSFVRGLFWPGLMTQYITTSEPRDDQVEVALAALTACIAAEKDGLAEVTDTPFMDNAAQLNEPLGTPAQSS